MSFFFLSGNSLTGFFPAVRDHTVSESGWTPLAGQQELLGKRKEGHLTFLCVLSVSFTFSTMSMYCLFIK